MPYSRRQFLAGSAAVGLALPPFLRRAALAAPRADAPGGEDTVLVVVQLSGGNDGLNTVVPYADPAYRRLRPTLAQPSGRVLKIDDELALHPEMTGFSQLLEDSCLSVVQGIGYPNATRSHFESMDTWHRASPDESERFGWLGKARVGLPGGGGVFVGEGTSPLAMFNATGHPLTVQSLDEHRLPLDGERGRRTRSTIESLLDTEPTRSNELLELARSSTRSMLEAEERFRRAAEENAASGDWPDSGLARRLRVVAQLLAAKSPERIYYVELDGFDTHSGQAPSHARLLGELSTAVAAFRRSLEQSGQQKRVLLMTFSEFGRRVKENGSQGTDHGAASQMFLVGDAVKPGVVGDHPSLEDLEQGDLRHHTDFRSVYRTVLEDWLRVPAETILPGDHPKLDLLQA